MVNQARCFLGTHGRLVARLQLQRLRRASKADSAHPTIFQEYTSVTKAVYTNPFLVRT